MSFIRRFYATLADEEDIVLLEAAQRCVDEADGPELREWLWSQRYELVKNELGRIQRSERHKQRSKPAQFKAATKEFARTGNAGVFSAFHTRFCVNEDNVHRLLGKMTREDHQFVAERYDRTVRSQSRMRDFHLLVADRIPEGKVTEEVFSEDQYLKLQKEMLAPEQSAK